MIPILAIFSDYGLLALRLALGGVLLAHGIGKIKRPHDTAEWLSSAGFRPGILFTWIAIAVEVLGGAMIFFGFLTQIAAFFATLQFIVIITWRLWKRDNFIGGWELDALMLAGAFTLVTIGGGMYSLEQWFLVL